VTGLQSTFAIYFDLVSYSPSDYSCVSRSSEE